MRKQSSSDSFPVLCNAAYIIRRLQARKDAEYTKKNTNLKTCNNMNELELLKQAARDFLNVADELYENVSNYMNGSNDPTDVNAYNRVKEKNAYFIKLHNEYYGENRVPSLDYELAESLLPELFEDFTD